MTDGTPKGYYGYGLTSVRVWEPSSGETERAAAALWEEIHNLPPGAYANTREKEKERYRNRARIALIAARGEAP